LVLLLCRRSGCGSWVLGRCTNHPDPGKPSSSATTSCPQLLSPRHHGHPQVRLPFQRWSRERGDAFAVGTAEPETAYYRFAQHTWRHVVVFWHARSPRVPLPLDNFNWEVEPLVQHQYSWLHLERMTVNNAVCCGAVVEECV
jgi:hypothetical protein